jgi:hypothetical protein
MESRGDSHDDALHTGRTRLAWISFSSAFLLAPRGFSISVKTRHSCCVRRLGGGGLCVGFVLSAMNVPSFSSIGAIFFVPHSVPSGGSDRDESGPSGEGGTGFLHYRTSKREGNAESYIRTCIVWYFFKSTEALGLTYCTLLGPYRHTQPP